MLGPCTPAAKAHRAQKAEGIQLQHVCNTECRKGTIRLGIGQCGRAGRQPSNGLARRRNPKGPGLQGAAQGSLFAPRRMAHLACVSYPAWRRQGPVWPFLTWSSLYLWKPGVEAALQKSPSQVRTMESALKQEQNGSWVPWLAVYLLEGRTLANKNCL